MAGKRAGASGRATAGAGTEAKGSGGTPRVRLLVGGDHARIEREIASLRESALGPGGSPDTDAVSVNAAEGGVSLPAVLSDARSVPFLSANRFVLVRHVDRFDWSESDREALAAYVADPPSTTVLVLTADALPRNQRPYTTLDSADAVVECPDVRTNESLDDYAARLATERGFGLDRRLAGILVDRIGADPTRLRNEIEKLVLHLGGRADATEDDLDLLLPDRKVMQTIWGLTGALARRDFSESIYLLRQAATKGEAPYMIVGLLSKNLREAMAARQAMNAGQGYKEIQALVGSPFSTQKAMEMARSFREDELAGLLRAMHRADLRMKSGAQPAAALEDSLYGLAAAR